MEIFSSSSFSGFSFYKSINQHKSTLPRTKHRLLAKSKFWPTSPSPPLCILPKKKKDFQSSIVEAFSLVIPDNPKP